ncbi:MAG: FAD-dependent oxidoreductase [Nitrospirae bacterium]|nr:FAD-dependent oxidoreductase [Nitrospirota bacterium]
MKREKPDVLVLGGGLAGLSAGVALTRAGRRVLVLEGNPGVGGLARTLSHGPFRFDLGGHRFFTKDEAVETFLLDLMGDELVTVSRSSKILLRDRYIDYPLKPLNAVRGLGLPVAVRILFEYAQEQIKGWIRPPRLVSLEDWVVNRFGRTLYRIYFRDYSEKVWGIGCGRICKEWVEQRIQGLSLGAAIRKAFVKPRGKPIATLVNRFLYPSLGIGRIAERMREEIAECGAVLTDARIERLTRRGDRIASVSARHEGLSRVWEAETFISTIPIAPLVRMLDPAPPDDVLRAADRLRFRDLILVVVMLDRPRVTDQTWIYIPERAVPFGRIHEPTNWSARMAPEGQTLLVTEHFCFRSDPIWGRSDAELTEETVSHLERLGFIRRKEVLGSVVLRIPKAYPLFEVGYRAHLGTIAAYLSRFENLRLAGRGGMFRYYNMDHAMASGLEAAEAILRSFPAPEEAAPEDLVLEEIPS